MKKKKSSVLVGISAPGPGWRARPSAPCPTPGADAAATPRPAAGSPGGATGCGGSGRWPPRASRRASTWRVRSGYANRPALPQEHALCGARGPLKTARHRLAPAGILVGQRGRAYGKAPQTKCATKLPCPRGDTTRHENRIYKATLVRAPRPGLDAEALLQYIAKSPEEGGKTAEG